MKKSPSGQAAPKKPLIAWPTARRPAWISDEELEWLPDDARQEAVELIASTYQELVVEASSALERAAGEEFVFLFWLGLLRSLRLRGHSRRMPGEPQIFGDRPETEIQNYLQLGLARQRVANLLLRIKEWLARWRRDGALQAAAIPSALAAEPVMQPQPVAQPASASVEGGRHSGPEHSSGRQPRNVPSAEQTQAATAGTRETDGGQNGRSDNGACPLPEGEGAARHQAGPLPEGVGAVASHVAPCAEAEGGLSRVPTSSDRGDELEKPKSEGQNGLGVLKRLPASL